MTFLEAKKIVEGKGYHVVKNPEDESFRQRVAREELEEAKRELERMRQEKERQEERQEIRFCSFLGKEEGQGRRIC